MNYKKQPIGIVLVTAIASLLLAGTILVPTQASALSKFNTNTDTSNLKHGIRDGVSVSLEHRNQHMNQENLCYRANTCRQSDVGQNTLGNDNSVTGFADQSDNIQEPAAGPAPTNTTTAPGNQTGGNSTTPTPTPRTCVECFTTILNATQTTALLNVFTQSSLANLCTAIGATPLSEAGFRTILTSVGVGASVTTANDLIACLKAAGIVFAP